MKFTVSTKPLKNVTDLGIIKANISKFYYRSNVVQITANRDTLKLNVEASGIKSRMTLKGSGDEDATKSILVDCSVFKSLIDGIDTDTMSIEFIDGGMRIQAGTSKFAIPQMLDVNDVQLDEPVDQYTASSTITVKPADWQFVKDHQMYAISSSAQHPVYKNVWVGSDKDILVGDFDSSLFTYSKKGEFDTTCLFPTSLINLFTSIPDGSTVSKVGRNYVLNIETDSYSMLTEFIPKYEDDEAVGSYNSGIILGMLAHPESYITIDVSPVTKFINQSSLLNQSDLDKIIEIAIADNTMTLTNKDSSYTMQVTSSESYSVKFDSTLLKSVLSNFDDDKVNIAPMTREEPDGDAMVTKTIGCIFWTDNLTTLLAGQE